MDREKKISPPSSAISTSENFADSSLFDAALACTGKSGIVFLARKM
jgi:hypothetical protein